MSDEAVHDCNDMAIVLETVQEQLSVVLIAFSLVPLLFLQTSYYWKSIQSSCGIRQRTVV